MADRCMAAAAIATVLATAAALSPALADQEASPSKTVRISGEIQFKRTASIVLRLLSRDQSGKEGTERRQVLPISAEDAARGSVHYEFAELAPGRYAVMCFQDTNGNGKLDIGMFGPKEPATTYRLARPKFRAPHFEEMAFDATQDVTNADLILR
jgi:uncharacterized protein (DUF2141 family)